MRLIERLSGALATEESYFRQYLIREDIARLERLIAMAPAYAEPSEFVAAALKIGWTPGDSRTHELQPALAPLLEAIHRLARTGSDADLEAEIETRWHELEALRMDRLVGCLARVPRPPDPEPG